MNFKDTNDLNNGMVAWPKDTDTSPIKESDFQAPKFFGLSVSKPEGSSYCDDPVFYERYMDTLRKMAGPFVVGGK